MLAPVNSLPHQPRHIPWSTRLTALFGSGFQSFGWLFFGFGMIFAFVFVGSVDASSFFKFRGTLEKAEGVIVSSEKSGYSEGGSGRRSGTRRKGTPIYRHDYTYQLNGVTQQGVSYSKGGALTVGQKVQVEFPQGRPATSRIRGMRTAPFGPAVLFVLIFPLAGLGLAVPGLFSGWKNLTLLKRGELARGRLIEKKKTSTQINKQYVYKLTFQYTDQFGQQHQVQTKTHLPAKLEDDAEERLLYDPLRPSRAVFVDTLPGAPEISEEGSVASVRIKSLLGSILPPIIALLVVLGGLILRTL
jgi:hypothetical protein